MYKSTTLECYAAKKEKKKKKIDTRSMIYIHSVFFLHFFFNSTNESCAQGPVSTLAAELKCSKVKVFQIKCNVSHFSDFFHGRLERVLPPFASPLADFAQAAREKGKDGVSLG